MTDSRDNPQRRLRKSNAVGTNDVFNAVVGTIVIFGIYELALWLVGSNSMVSRIVAAIGRH